MSSTSSYSQSSFSPMSSPYTPPSQTSESFVNDNVFKFPPILQDQYIVSLSICLSIMYVYYENIEINFIFIAYT